MFNWFHKYLSPKNCYKCIQCILPYLSILCLVLFLVGTIWSLYLSPADYQQGDSVRIMYIHVPSAIMSLGVYTFMSAMAVISLVWHVKVAACAMKSAQLAGMVFTLIALVTGSIWGKPMWGTWWIWDARLTSELILLFMYFGLIGLSDSEQDLSNDKLVAFLTLIGFVNIPIIHYSVEWWSTLHQKASISKFAAPSIHPSMLYPLLVMLAAFGIYFILIACYQLRAEIIKREANTSWVKTLISASAIK